MGESPIQCHSTSRLPAAIFLFGSFLSFAAFADIAIVSGESTPVAALELAQVKGLWLGTLERIEGTKLRVAERTDPAIRDLFYRRVLERTPGQMKAIRAKRGFQHGIPPPPAFPDDAGVLDWIRSGRNRVGYVALPIHDAEGIKVLLVVASEEGEALP